MAPAIFKLIQCFSTLDEAFWLSQSHEKTLTQLVRAWIVGCFLMWVHFFFKWCATCPSTKKGNWKFSIQPHILAVLICLPQLLLHIVPHRWQVLLGTGRCSKAMMLDLHALHEGRVRLPDSTHTCLLRICSLSRCPQFLPLRLPPYILSETEIHLALLYFT